ncbi:MAG: hypothetical protein V4736_10435, partial [Bdellovibrionota bacterium]
MKSLAIISGLFLISTAYAGNTIGNGGGTVTCKRSAENNYNGEYFLDYLIQFNANLPPVSVVKL